MMENKEMMEMMQKMKGEKRYEKMDNKTNCFYSDSISIIALVFIALSPLVNKWFGLSRQLTLILLIALVIINLFLIVRNAISKNQ